MAKGQMRSNKEKKKPKADKNLKKGGAAPANPFAAGKTPAGQSPNSKKSWGLGLSDRPERGAERLGIGHDGVADKAQRFAGALRRIGMASAPFGWPTMRTCIS
jgi:hypothetical protein